MIASALRTEIDQFCNRVCDGAPDGDHLARCSASLQRLTRGARAAAIEESPASMRALAALVQRELAEHSAGALAHRALSETLAARLGLPGADRGNAERALDALDDRVDDPRELGHLRQSLRGLIDQFERLCEEGRTARSRAAHDASAA